MRFNLKFSKSLAPTELRWNLELSNALDLRPPNDGFIAIIQLQWPSDPKVLIWNKRIRLFSRTVRKSMRGSCWAVQRIARLFRRAIRRECLTLKGMQSNCMVQNALFGLYWKLFTVSRLETRLWDPKWIHTLDFHRLTFRSHVGSPADRTSDNRLKPYCDLSALFCQHCLGQAMRSEERFCLTNLAGHFEIGG